MIRRDVGSGAASVDLSRVELEQLARERAERLLTPAARAEQNEPSRPTARASEPSLEDRLAAIERRAREHAAEEKRAITIQYLDEAHRRFERAVSETSDQTLRSAYLDLQRAERLADTVRCLSVVIA